MTVGIVGYGRFGALWADMVADQHPVRVYARTLPDTAPRPEIQFTSVEEVAQCDLLFLVVPISAMQVACESVAPHLSSTSIVIDACSVKVEPAEIMQQYLPKEQPIIATHPLFGPDSVQRDGLEGQKIVIDMVRATAEQGALLEALCKVWKLQVIRATCAEHDKQMAQSQALVHFIGRAFHELGLGKQDIATPDYASILRIDELVNNDTWELFMDMQQRNPYARQMRTTLVRALAELEEKIAYENKDDVQ